MRDICHDDSYSKGGLTVPSVTSGGVGSGEALHTMAGALEEKVYKLLE